jgi:hypothetical protein
VGGGGMGNSSPAAAGREVATQQAQWQIPN